METYDRIMEPNYSTGVITIIWGCLCITLKIMYTSTSFFILLQAIYTYAIENKYIFESVKLRF